MYRQNARRDYLNLAKCKKRTAKKIRKAIKQQLQYIHRDRGYLDALSESKKNWLGLPVDDVIRTIRKYMTSLEN